MGMNLTAHNFRAYNIFTIFTFVLLTLLLPAVVLAQEIVRESVGAGDYGDFVVGPGKVELPLNPGESRVIQLTVTNRLGEPRVFNLEIEDAAGTQDPTRPVVLLGKDTGPYTLKDYIQLPTTSFVLGAGERARIPVTIALPEDSEPGGKYGSVLVTTTTLPNENTLSSDARPSSAIISRIGTLFFITTPGEVELDGSLVSFETKLNKKLFGGGPIDFSILFENKGSIHLNPFGSITVSNMLGENVGFVELDPWYALPQSLRLREASWSREVLFGRYTATLELNKGYNDEEVSADLVFWVLPWKFIATAFGVLLIVITLVRFLVSNFEFRRK